MGQGVQVEGGQLVVAGPHRSDRCGRGTFHDSNIPSTTDKKSDEETEAAQAFPQPRRGRDPWWSPGARPNQALAVTASIRAGTCLCHGVPAYASRHSVDVNALGATPGTDRLPSAST